MADGKYTLAELSELTELQPRKVRYYMHQDLVPRADGTGKGRYGDEQLAALSVVKALREAGLSLKTIKEYLGAGEDDAEDQSAPGAGVIAEVVATLSASADRLHPARLKDITDSVLGVGPSLLSKVLGALGPMSRSASQRLSDFASPLSGFGRRAGSKGDATQRSTWERIPIARQLEIHVMRPLSREQNRSLTQLIERAHELFPEDPKPLRLEGPDGSVLL